MMPRALLLFVLLTLLVACSGAATSTPSDGSAVPASPATSDGPAQTPGEIDHATGATDVILRYEEGGGFMMPAFAVTMAPIFTLYGDGTVIFRNPTVEPPPAAGPVIRQNPYRTATLSEDQVQELLEFALIDGGLGTAKLQYDNPLIADAGTAMFTVRAGGLDKTVNVYALGLNDAGVPDLPARAQFSTLAERLANFDQDGTFATDMYVPAGYRAILIDTGGFPGAAPVAWPWDDIAPSAFTTDPASGVAFPSRVMTAEELAVLGVEDIEGGFQGMTLVDPDDSAKTYTLAVRPLLPDELP